MVEEKIFEKYCLRAAPGTQFVSNLLLEKKKDGYNSSVISFKNLDQFVFHHHFEIEWLQ